MGWVDRRLYDGQQDFGGFNQQQQQGINWPSQADPSDPMRSPLFPPIYYGGNPADLIPVRVQCDVNAIRTSKIDPFAWIKLDGRQTGSSGTTPYPYLTLDREDRREEQVVVVATGWPRSQKTS